MILTITMTKNHPAKTGTHPSAKGATLHPFPVGDSMIVSPPYGFDGA
jgi:hypothetical protein